MISQEDSWQEKALALEDIAKLHDTIFLDANTITKTRKKEDGIQEFLIAKDYKELQRQTLTEGITHIKDITEQTTKGKITTTPGVYKEIRQMQKLTSTSIRYFNEKQKEHYTIDDITRDEEEKTARTAQEYGRVLHQLTKKLRHHIYDVRTEIELQQLEEGFRKLQRTGRIAQKDKIREGKQKEPDYENEANEDIELLASTLYHCLTQKASTALITNDHDIEFFLQQLITYKQEFGNKKLQKRIEEALQQQPLTIYAPLHHENIKIKNLRTIPTRNKLY